VAEELRPGRDRVLRASLGLPSQHGRLAG
jgi:hypothetical protein